MTYNPGAQPLFFHGVLSIDWNTLLSRLGRRGENTVAFFRLNVIDGLHDTGNHQ